MRETIGSTWAPSSVSPTISNPSSASSALRIPSSMSRWSSAMTTRMPWSVAELPTGTCLVHRPPCTLPCRPRSGGGITWPFGVARSTDSAHLTRIPNTPVVTQSNNSTNGSAPFLIHQG